jgi:hypothetical protein
MLKEVEQLRAGYLSSRDQISALKKQAMQKKQAKFWKKCLYLRRPPSLKK